MRGETPHQTIACAAGAPLDQTKGFGGADRDRTDDLVIANDALSQLSYGPTTGGFLRTIAGEVKSDGALRGPNLTALMRYSAASA